MTNLVGKEDHEFIKKLEAFEFEPAKFDHRAHVRMAYIYLCEYDTDVACQRVRHTLCGLLSHNSIEPSGKYHETLTRAWTLAVRHLMACSPNTDSSLEFIEANPELLDSGIMKAHYTKELLFSEAARTCFVEPDLAPIPQDVDERIARDH